MAEPEFPAVDRLVSDAQRRRAMAVMEQEREKARILREIQAKDKPLEDPWIDPVSAFAGGFGGALPNALKKLGTMGLKALMRPVVSGAAGAAADIPIGAATEKIGEKVPGAALPFNILAGMGSGATLGRMVDEALSNPKMFKAFSKSLLGGEAGEIKFGGFSSRDAAKATIKSAVEAGDIDGAVRFTTPEELFGILKTGRLTPSEDYGAVYASRVMGKDDSVFPAYGNADKTAVAIVFPKNSLPPGSGKEITVNPDVSVDKLRFVVGDKTYSFDQMRKSFERVASKN